VIDGSGNTNLHLLDATTLLDADQNDD
jgi:hypothetical protein